MNRRKMLLASAAVVGATAGAARLRPGAAQAADAWQLRWAPEAGTHGLAAFEGVEDDRANSHPAGQPHIFVSGNDYRFNMHMVDRDTMTDRQRQEVRGMVWGGADLILLPGETWRLTHRMFIPGSLKATTTFTHIMQTKAPGTDTLPMITMSLRRYSGVEKVELVVSGVTVGNVDLVPLRNKWIDVELEMVIGDAPTGRVRWVLRDGATTVIDVTRSGVDTFLQDRVRPKWGIYRSLGDTSGSLQDCYLLVNTLRAYKWGGAEPPPVGTRYEAEDALISQGAAENNHAGYTGTGFVNLDNVAGSYVQWTVNAATASIATLSFRYANGTTAARPLDVTVNGTLAADELAFAPTDGWEDWDTRALAGVRLRPGANAIRATSTGSSGGPNLDNLEVQLVSGPADYQAEDATISQGAVESDHAGFTGSGYVDTDNISGAYVQFTAVGQATAIAIRYANGTTVDRPMTLTVDGTSLGTVSLPPTGAWTTWATTTKTVSLPAGTHTVRLTATTANGGPNLDKITLS
ncbi:carbohydrate-binding protein [Hamadaea tsunoensis]|uniref:carbohydrate-binding protein n=1 Tax=Hamadaea tsunoensis TaxID=53368 RepID=UPI0012F8E7C1|nr:carbohydrate-binding protein [Hamadaea tsunoensis]